MKKIILNILLLITANLLFSEDIGLTKIDTLDNKTLLNGEWEFYIDINGNKNINDINDVEWQKVYMPKGNINKDGKLKSSIYYLKKDLHVSETLKGEGIGLYLGKITTCDKTYFNGSLIGGKGSFPPEFKATPFTPSYYFVPSSLIKYGETNTILIKSFYSFEGGIIEDEIFATNYKDFYLGMRIGNLIHRDINIVIIVSLLLFFFYHLFMFIKNPSEKSNLYFSINLICISLYYLPRFIENPPVTFLISEKIIYSCMYAGVLSLVLFFEINQKIFIKNIFKILVIINAISIFLQYVSVDMFMHRSIYSVHFFIVIAEFFYIFYIIITALRKGNKNALTLFAGLIIVFVFIINDISYVFMNKLPTIWLFPFSLPFFIMSIVIYLANKSMNSYREVDNLNKQIENKVNNLNKMINEIEKSSKRVEESKNLLSGSIYNMSGNVTSMIKEINSLYKEIDIQYSKINEALDSSKQTIDMVYNVENIVLENKNTLEKNSEFVNKMSESINNVVLKSKEANNISKDFKKYAQSGSLSLNEVLKTIKKVEESSNKIIGIISLISDISEKTKILAINAAIESARAGEAGKGFSIVSGEIRHLANDTRSGVNDINIMVNEIISRVKLSVENSIELEKKLNIIIKGSDDLDNINSSLFLSMNEQAENSKTMVQNINIQRDMGGNISDIIKKEKKSIEIINKSLTDLKVFTDGILKLADLLTNKSNGIEIMVNEISKVVVENEKVINELKELISAP